MRVGAKFAAGILAGAAAAAISFGQGLPTDGPLSFASAYWVAVSVVVVSAGFVPIASGLRDLFVARREPLRRDLEYVAQEIWFSVCRNAPRFTIDDVGIHVFVARRSRFRPWVIFLSRVARVAEPGRQPAPVHSTWEPGKGVVGRAFQSQETDAWNLADPAVRSVGQEEWNRMRRAESPLCRNLSWEEFDRTRRWFSAVFAVPIKNEDGVLGVISANIESNVSDGFCQLEEAKIRTFLNEGASRAANRWPR